MERVASKFRSTKYELFCRGKELLWRLPTAKEITDATPLLVLSYDEELNTTVSTLVDKCAEVQAGRARHGRKTLQATRKSWCAYTPKLCDTFAGKVKPSSLRRIVDVEAELSARGVLFTRRAEGGTLTFTQLKQKLDPFVDDRGFLKNGRLGEVASGSATDPFTSTEAGTPDEEEDGSWSVVGWLRNLVGQ